MLALLMLLLATASCSGGEDNLPTDAAATDGSTQAPTDEPTDDTADNGKPDEDKTDENKTDAPDTDVDTPSGDAEKPEYAPMLDIDSISLDSLDMLNFTENTNITLAPAVITEVTDTDSLEDLVTTFPEIAILTLDADGNVTDTDGGFICYAEDVPSHLPEGTIPAFNLPSSVDYDITFIRNLLCSLDSSDVMVISDDEELIAELRSEAKQLIGVIDFREWGWDGMRFIDARSAANRAGARICLLPIEYADSPAVEFFNTLGMSVWFKAQDNDLVEMIRLITSGANGIITPNLPLLYRCLACDLFLPNSIVRPVGVIGHRGMPSQAPENTLAGSDLAAKYGANIIENDIYITSDDVIVVMHDSTLDRTTDGVGEFEGMTYEELCKYAVDDKPDASGLFADAVEDPQPIPTLEEYLELFKDTDTYIFIEIKSSQADRLVPVLKDMIDEYDFYDQCSVICFSKSTLQTVKEIIPELSVGYLCDTAELDDILSSTAECESSYNPAHANLTGELLRTLSVRGILSWPWTVNESADFDRFFLMGVGGITTNYANYARNYVKRVSTDKIKYSLDAGESVEIGVKAEYYGAVRDGDTYDNSILPTNKSEMIILSGNETLSFDGISVSAEKAGEATVIFRLRFRLNDESYAYVYSQPVKITVN